MTRELESIRNDDSVPNQVAKEWQTKLKILEQSAQQLSEEKDLIERQLRATQVERNELQQDIVNLNREW